MKQLIRQIWFDSFQMFSLLRMTILASGDADALIIPGQLSFWKFFWIAWCNLFHRFVCSDAWIIAHFLFADINTINTWAEPHNANGVTPNTIIDSNDEPPGNNQQRIATRNY